MREQMHDQLEQCEPVRPERPVFVDVYAHKDESGDIKFRHDWRLRENGPVKGNGDIEVPAGTPPSPIHFHLHDESGRKLKFFQDAEEAIWASVGKCPDAKGGGGQIEYPEARSGCNALKVDNTNSAECELHYALRFEDRDGRVVVYDPVIKNKGNL